MGLGREAEQMPAIKVQSIGEHVVVTPGRHEVLLADPLDFWIENTCGGDIEVWFPHPGVLKGVNSTKKYTVAHGASSQTFSVVNNAAEGEYEYVVKYTIPDPDPKGPDKMKTVKRRLVNARVGFAIGGSSPRIIVKPTS
jgi:hypothetical protein